MKELELPSLNGEFQKELKQELNAFLNKQKSLYPAEEVLKIDLHSHDHNSDEPDELLGRILNVPETWLKTDKLIETLNRNNVDLITITNHNNARSCFELKKKGKDILVGAEFSCMVPDFNVGIHVLAYGFTEEQEKILNKLRRDIYKFQRYTFENSIPTVWAHPLYHYKSEGVPTMDFFNKMALIFERFEVLNGQRNTWQNLLVKFWLDKLTPEKIDELCDKFNINSGHYCSNPYKKNFTGGSDSHMGIFSGQTGTYLHVPDLKERLKKESASVLALEALRNGDLVPYGNYQNFEKLTIAFLDYVCQIALYKKDPGLIRILLHKGTANDKLLALFISNAFTELQQHKVTMRFIEMFHNCFTGNSPALSKRLFVPKAYKSIFDDAAKISKLKKLPGDEMVELFNNYVNSICNKLNDILYTRINNKVTENVKTTFSEDFDLNEIIEKIEIPSDIRSLIGKKTKNLSGNKNAAESFGDFLDGLSFPFLASSIILAANFTSARVMYNNRELLNSFSKEINHLRHPERVLWLTDTFEDKNGVSMFLKDMLKEIQKRDLPIDLLVCSNNVQPEEHLIVVKPLSEFKIPYYDNQSIRIPNFNEIHNMFLNNEYDRIVCSTEGIMGLMSLYLKHAYSVKTYFYMHTDWIMFARKVLKLDIHNLNRIRRFFRAYYKAFDGLFVLNSDHQKWLTGNEMGIDSSKVFHTAHWVDEMFKPVEGDKEKLFGVSKYEKVLLFAGRLSAEKGVFEIPRIYENLKIVMPHIKMVFVGTGPAEKELKKELPDALFLGWVDHKRLPEIYSTADLLILPSKFDTFSCVVLEAMSCGLPVVAYKSKGPKDIIQDGINGYLVSGQSEMEYRIYEYFSFKDKHKPFKLGALERALDYQADYIIRKFLEDLQLNTSYSYEKVTV